MEQSDAPRSRRRPRRVGPVLLVLATVAALAVIAWGVGGSRPSTVTTLAPVEAKFAAVTRGALVETTRVSATVSRGEVISLTVPMAGDGGTTAPGSATSAASPVGSVPAGSSTTMTTTTTAPVRSAAPPTTSPPPTTTTTVAPTTVAPTTTDPGTTTTTAPAGPTTTMSAPPPTTAPPTTTTTVAARSGSATGTGSSGTSTDVTSAGSGAATTTGATTTTARVVTAVSSVGTVLHAGDTAFAIDGRPTIVLPGFVPAWRAIDSSTSDGVDVAQLESFLAGAGFDDGGRLVVDEHVTSATVAAVEDWQTSLDLDATGRIELGEVVFLAGDVTVVASNAEVGSVLDAGETVVDVRTGSPFVDVSTDASWVAVGDRLDVSLGGSTVTGTVSTFSAGIARVTLPAATTVRDGSDATVRLERTKVDGELLVPSSAILREDLAGPTVAVKAGDEVRTVRVTVLAAANSTAAVRPHSTRDLAEGDQVARY